MVSAGPGRIRKTTMSDQHTAFEELPLAIDTPIGDGRIHWEAVFLVKTATPGHYQQGKVWARVQARVDEGKASELRLKQEQRGNLMCGMLVDARGVVYGISSVYVGGPPETTGDDVALSQVDVARARLIDLASSWRQRGATYGPGAGVLLACASELDEAVIELLASSEDECPDD
jgi:hypothetical protein